MILKRLRQKPVGNDKEGAEKAVLKCKQPRDIAIISGIILYPAAYSTLNRSFAAPTLSFAAIFCDSTFCRTFSLSPGIEYYKVKKKDLL